jgi:curved DNA-binding protein CbpA
MLGLSRSASQDEIKTAFRRLARQWHPDICKEANAQEQFIKIKQAFDILSDPDLRARYNAGLALEASLKCESGIRSPAGTSYRSPYRCGYVLAEGQQALYFMVDKILAWEDIYNSQGQMLVTSWPAGAKTFTEVWV